MTTSSSFFVLFSAFCLDLDGGLDDFGNVHKQKKS